MQAQSAPELRGRRVLVMGLGVHGGGVGVARYLASAGARVTVTDLQPAARFAGSIEPLEWLGVRFVLGEHRQEDFERAELIIRNPAVPADSPYLQSAAARGTPVWMEMTLFFAACPSRRITGVTGTKGKTTTTTAIGHILRQAGRNVVVAGNLRISALEQLPQIDAQTDVVLELSSFQLEGLAPIRRSPATAVITNLLRDHLNRYASLEAYFEAKKEIFRYQGPDDVLVLNRDNPASRPLAEEARAQVLWFGLDAAPAGVARSGLHGAHNRSNLAAAAVATGVLGVDEETIGEAIATFKGVPYRQELVGEIAGVQYVNDTAATTPDATLAALAAADRPVILIAGGADKGLDLALLCRAIGAPESCVRAVVLLDGSATDHLQHMLGPLVAGHFRSMAEAVQCAQQLARPGEQVLLSPGCASFGLFAHEFDRGDQFNAAVRSLQPPAA